MDLQVKLDGQRDLAGQIYRQIRAVILTGRLRPGDPVPATRELARRLGVARSTVGAAYDRLAGEGFLDSRVGAGTFVSPAVRAEPPDQPTGGALRPRPDWPVHRVWEHFPAVHAEFDFRAGIPDLRMFPFGSWRRMISAQLRPTAMRSSLYGETAGVKALRRAIARHVGTSRAVDAHPDNVIVTNGTQQALDLVARVLLGPGDCVAVEEPGYPAPWDLFRTLGARVVPVPVDDQGMVVERIPAEARMVYVTPSHHFPLGVTMSLSRRMALLAWAGERNAAVVEDDYDSEFRFGGRPLESLQGMDRAGRVVYVGTFSKTMLPALRMGFLVAPPSLVPALHHAKFVSDWHSPTPAQAALAEFIDEGLFARHVRRMRTEYQARQETIISSLPADGVMTPLPSAAGMHVAVLLPADVPVDTLPLARKAWAADVALHPLSDFYAGAPPRAGLILGYGGIDRARIPDGLVRLRGVLT
ncbi:MAG TPA: PLP-dependent aminotransferase family protein [Micromonosporaceae bacterium]|nr:PLP-dependent aminotransferase family protein [Micromonosporaceae bacterium]